MKRHMYAYIFRGSSPIGTNTYFVNLHQKYALSPMHIFRFANFHQKYALVPMHIFSRPLKMPSRGAPRGRANSSSPKVLTQEDVDNEPGAVGTIDQYPDHTDPKYVGPGTWNVIHRRSFKAQDKERQLAFIQEMQDICYGFPCSVCRGHCTEYIKTHPLEEYLNTEIEIEGEMKSLGMFIWGWRFHNAVNTRLKKPLMSWDTAYTLYSEKNGMMCSKSCLEAEAHI